MFFQLGADIIELIQEQIQKIKKGKQVILNNRADTFVLGLMLY
jgi:hypothetical protein